MVGLVTTVTAGYERVAMQGIRRDVLHAQAEAAGLPLIEAMIPPACDNAVYEAAFAAALAAGARALAAGLDASPSATCSCRTSAPIAMAMCARLGWTVLTPAVRRRHRGAGARDASTADCARVCAAWIRSS